MVDVQQELLDITNDLDKILDKLMQYRKRFDEAKEKLGLKVCEICETNPPRTPESKWCESCRDDFKGDNNG